MYFPERVICKKDYKVDWCISCKSGQSVRVHDWNDVAVQLAWPGNLIWVDMNEFNEFFEV